MSAITAPSRASPGSSSRIAGTVAKLAGPALRGVYCIADFRPEANDESRTSIAKHGARDKLGPNGLSSWAYDALKVLAHAVKT